MFRMVFKVSSEHADGALLRGPGSTWWPIRCTARHVIVDAVGALYSTCRRALASPEDSPERALARSALARRARKWGCTRATYEWLGSRQHLDAAVVMEREIETGAMAVEAFDFFILYTAWLSRQDTAIFQERAERGEKPAPLRNAMSVEHDCTTTNIYLNHSCRTSAHLEAHVNTLRLRRAVRPGAPPLGLGLLASSRAGAG